ncbi:glycoside hydrolase [candidate division KSB1 bacterium]|nr:glycoside hydrolase [candidate division KSB1 bacterium]
MRKIWIKSWILLGVTFPVFAMNLQQEIDLHGEWRFEIGDNTDYAEADYDDSNWELIQVPGTWENEGFPGYDGFAWYRIRFFIPKDLRSKVLYFKLGRIDDADRVYLNGNLIGGKGNFPPEYKTAFNVKRIYFIPKGFVRFGAENTLAIKVFDHQGSGGITNGEIGLYSRLDILKLAVNLSGYWKFSPGDSSHWANSDYDDQHWDLIRVPGYWEEQGYDNLDGYAWYRKSFSFPKALNREKVMLVLGYINDADQVFLNGIEVGKTGNLNKYPKSGKRKNHLNEERAYFILSQLFRKNQLNVICIRVFDYGRVGGISKGYIGLTTHSEYLKYSKRKGP